jgi:hypothetical protein
MSSTNFLKITGIFMKMSSSSSVEDGAGSHSQRQSYVPYSVNNSYPTLSEQGITALITPSVITSFDDDVCFASKSARIFA